MLRERGEREREKAGNNGEWLIDLEGHDEVQGDLATKITKGGCTAVPLKGMGWKIENEMWEDRKRNLILVGGMEYKGEKDVQEWISEIMGRNMKIKFIEM